MDLKLRGWLSLVVILLWNRSTLAVERTWEAQESLYEIGLAGASFFLYDYPAAEQGRLRALIVPYAYYRGKVLRADDEGGIRGRLLERERIEFDFSAAAAFPADSRDNHARRGMPDLDWIGEVGPRMRVHIIEEENLRFEFNLPVRYVFSTDLTRVDDRGYLFQPELSLKIDNVWGEGWDFSLSTSAQFASDQLMDYFYEVSNQYATIDRPAFQSRGGLLGNNLVLGVSREVRPRMRAFCGAKFDYYGLSVNRRSPLFKDPWNAGFAFGFSYQLYESGARAGTHF